jgi:hypothetical protein
MNTNEIIHKIIGYMPNEKIKFSRRKIPFHSDTIVMHFVNRFHELSINENSDWKCIKKMLDEYLNDPDLIPECPICFNKSLKNASCVKCNMDMCSECILDIIKTNKGICKCPFCRFESGHELNENDLSFHLAKTRCRWNTGK